MVESWPSKMVKPRVSDIDFVKKYMASKSSAELSTNTGLTIESARSRAAKLRKAGVALPKFNRTREIDISGLNAIVSSNATA